MKKISAFLICLLLVIGLCSCKTGKNSGSDANNTGNNNQNTDEEAKNLFYSSDREIQIVFEKGKSESANAVCEAVFALSGKAPALCGENAAVSEGEIVLGECNRDISKKAYSLLKNKIEKDEYDSGYLVYSDGKSLSLAYSGRAEKYLSGEAVEILIERFVFEDFVISEGVLYYRGFDLLEHLAQEDEKDAEEKWQSFAVKYGEDLALALRKLYSCYDDNIVDWFANLYDADIGGFYYSNSARNYTGFLPDLESTVQALGFITSSGMSRSYDGSTSYADAIPEEMGEQIIRFVKGLQYPNGYFYHPQWGRELTDSRLSRRGRDLSWATNILREFGVSPIYDTPNGVKGAGVEPMAGVTAPLSASKVSSVSKVVSASSDYIPEHLINKTNFERYLSSLKLTTDSYTVGNELSSQITQIVQRDKALVGEGYSLVDILINWLNRNQNPKNGTWDYLEEGDGNYSVFRGMDGLFKILCIYNEVGAELNYAKEALETTKHCITTETDANIVCDVYNTWYVIDMIFDNLTKYSSDRASGTTLAREELEKLRAEAPVLIKASTEKIVKFMQPDGAFRFSNVGGSYESQGVPVCVPGIDESDVNATVICTSGLVGHILASLDIPTSNAAPIFGAEDMQRFLDIINNLSPIVKEEFKYEIERFDFENDDLGKQPLDITVNNNSQGSIEVVKRGDGKALSIDSVRGGGDSVEAEVGQLLINSTCFVFETDMCIKSADRTDTLGEISLLDKGKNEIYMLYYSVSDGNVKLSDSSSNVVENRVICDLGDAGRLGEWFKLRVEYYVGDHDSLRIKIYIDGELIAVSDNYYDKGGLKLEGGVGTPRSTFYSTRISVFSYVTSEVCLDNIASYHTNDKYEIPANNEDLGLRVDYTDGGEKIHTFDEGFGDISAEGCVVEEKDGNGKIKLTDASIINLPFNIRATKANCSIASFDLVINRLLAGAGVDMLICESLGFDKIMLGISAAVREENGEKILEIYELYNGNLGNLIYSEKITLGETLNLKIEYYDDAVGALIYIENQLVTMSDKCYDAAKSRRAYYFGIKAHGTSEVLIDNLKAEKLVKSYDEASKPQNDEVIYDFTYLPSGIDTNGEIKGGALALNTDGFLTLPINSGGVVSNMILLETDLDLSDYAKNKELRIIFSDEDSDVIAYEIYLNSSYAYLCEYSEAKGRGAIVGSFSAVSKINLKIEFYIREQTANIYVGGELIGISSVVYNCQNQLKVPQTVTVKTFGDGLEIDEIKAELNYKSYKKENAKYESNIDKEIFTFEGDTTGNLPKRLTTALASTAASIKIKEAFYSGKYSNVLEFSTGSGANDNLVFSSYGIEEAHNMHKVSLDMCFVGTAPYDTFGFRIGKDLNEYVYSFEVNVAYGDVLLSITTTDPTSNTTSLARYKIAKDGEWFNLGCEYYFTGGSRSFMKVYINDSFVADLSGVFGTSDTNVTANSFEKLSLYSYSDTKATLLIDNFDITTEEKEYKVGGADKIATIDFEDGEVSSNGSLDSYGDYVTVKHPQNLSDGTKSAFADIKIDPKDAANKVLSLSSDRKSGGSGVGYPESAINANFGLTGNNKNGYCYVFEADIYISSESYLSGGVVATIFQNFTGSEKATGINVKLETDFDGKKQAYLTSYYGVDKETAIYTFACDEWVTLKFEFYRGKYAADNYGTVIYANGMEVARDLAWRTGLSSYDTRAYDAVNIMVDRYMAGNVLVDDISAYIEDKSPEIGE